ncbi:hypothetical protein FRB90_005212, partial [Tulasnella sp. 427]
RLREALKDTNERGLTNVKLDREFVEAIVRSLDGTKEKAMDLKGQIDNMKRTSQQYLAGFSVAQTEYHKEVAARRDAEAEITRLRVQLSGQAARLTAMSAEHRRQEMMEQMSKDLSSNLGVLEKDLSKLKVERDMALAEVEELNATPNQPVAVNDAPSNMTRSLTARFDNLKSQYKKDLEPLKQQREALIREINELKEARDIFLEETTALNARNEELAELNSQIQRQIEATMNESSLAPDNASISTTAASTGDHLPSSSENGYTPTRPSKGMPMQNIFGGGAKGMKSSAASIATMGSGGAPSNSPSYSSVNTAISSVDEVEFGARVVTTTKGVYQHAKEILPEPAPAKGSKFKWFGGAAKKQKQKAHNFAAVNILRFARCEHCNDKMWGPQFRCQGCGITCHQRCQGMIQTACQQSTIREDAVIVDIAPLPPSLFGRDLVEQVKADARGSDRAIPVIVEKCIEAVETLAMDYEGIYRKTGGSGQSKIITQLFEKGNYDSFDLRDVDSFNDICSVTSVLKNYFRALPNPLLTYALHDAFVGAACIRDPTEKSSALATLVRQLPREHFHTLRALMLHLYKYGAILAVRVSHVLTQLYSIQRRSDENLMNARNLGVVFGPTLMRSNDPSKEFADMAGKALSVEWLVEHAPEVFQDLTFALKQSDKQTVPFNFPLNHHTVSFNIADHRSRIPSPTGSQAFTIIKCPTQQRRDIVPDSEAVEQPPARPHLPNPALSLLILKATLPVAGLAFDKVLRPENGRRFWYYLRLNPPDPDKIGDRHSGTGIIYVNDRNIAGDLVETINENPIRIGNDKIRVHFAEQDGYLSRAIPVNHSRPTISQEALRRKKDNQEALRHDVRILAVQFGIEGRDRMSFSIEWEGDYNPDAPLRRGQQQKVSKPKATLKFNEGREGENPRSLQIEITGHSESDM